MNTNNRFILKPDFHNLGELGLDYKDLLTYITIRSFYNSNSKYCYPSYRAISKLSGLSTYFIGKSIKRLKVAGILNVWTVGKRRKSYWYMFENIAGLSKVSYELLLDSDLTTNEKAILILLSEYCKQGHCFESITEVADKSGVTYRIITSQYQTLLLKGYIAESMYEDPFTNTITKQFKMTTKLKWNLSPYSPPILEGNTSQIENILNIAQNHLRLKKIAERK